MNFTKLSFFIITLPCFIIMAGDYFLNENKKQCDNLISNKRYVGDYLCEYDIYCGGGTMNYQDVDSCNKYIIGQKYRK